MDKFKRYLDTIYENGQFQVLDETRIEWDRKVRNLVERVNPVAALQGRNLEPSYIKPFALHSLQSPLLVYLDGHEIYRVLSGYFTYSIYCQHRQPVAAYVLKKAPPTQFRELFFLNELTRCLLDQYFINSSSMVATFLTNWFEATDDSLFRNEKWLRLYPNLRTKAELCRWLGISSKTFFVKMGEG